uniref:Immunoglobulin domain-containing protein n=1 Tax=Cyprinus carpio TaxID=7962 RepID=A0A8C1LDM8_CYPCA
MKSSFSTELFLLLMCGVFGAETEEVKSVSVMKGGSVTLNPERNQTQGFIKIVWRFGDKGIIIADSSEKVTLVNETERFRDRLQLDLTGSLTITDMRTEHSGLYKVQIDRNTGTSFKKFSVTVLEPGGSSGAIAGTCVTVLLVAAAAVVYYYRHRICDLKRLMEPEISEQMLNKNEDTTAEQLCKKYEEKILSVMEGESVTLKIDAEIKGDDQILWMFGPQETLIAEIKSETREITTFDGIDGRFKDKLKLVKTASLTITNITAEHSGVYKLQTSSSRGTSFQRFIVNVKVMIISVVEGQSVTLYPDNTGAQKDDLIVWMFGDENNLIAQMTGKTRATYEGTDGIFRDRLKLDKRTGSLTIRNMRTEQSGLYKLQMSSSSKGTTNKRFNIVINLRMILGVKGKYVTLNPDIETQRDDLFLWMFGDENNLIAQLTGETKETTYTDADERFGDGLRLDKNTGSLTIKNITTGPYKLRIVSSRRNLNRKFRVFICCESGPKIVSAMVGESLILITDFTIERGERVQWSFQDKTLAAGMNGDISKTAYGDVRFKDRLELHHQTGSLTIKNTRTSDTGDYQLKFLSRSGKVICWEFKVTVSDSTMNRSAIVLMNEGACE